MSFSIPDDVKAAFNKAFEGENKCAVVTRLMVRAIDEHARWRRSHGFVERLREIRAQSQIVSENEIRRARKPSPMKLVVDASVALKWFVTARPEEDHSAQAEAVAKAIEDSQSELFAPPHWIAETAAMLAHRSRRDRRFAACPR